MLSPSMLRGVQVGTVGTACTMGGRCPPWYLPSTTYPLKYIRYIVKPSVLPSSLLSTQPFQFLLLLCSRTLTEYSLLPSLSHQIGQHRTLASPSRFFETDTQPFPFKPYPRKNVLIRGPARKPPTLLCTHNRHLVQCTPFIIFEYQLPRRLTQAQTRLPSLEIEICFFELLVRFPAGTRLFPL